jgi:hypothetical protein
MLVAQKSVQHGQEVEVDGPKMRVNHDQDTKHALEACSIVMDDPFPKWEITPCAMLLCSGSAQLGALQFSVCGSRKTVAFGWRSVAGQVTCQTG